jgi:hypothetical protein
MPSEAIAVSYYLHHSPVKISGGSRHTPVTLAPFRGVAEDEVITLGPRVHRAFGPPGT